MVKYFHLEHGRLSEITEGEYEFRLRKLYTFEDDPEIALLTQPGHGFESRYGSCFVLEVPDAKA
jgi:hypothetical protein